jgi:Zn finger protein HypA/HybF involved in hydrogenase expression
MDMEQSRGVVDMDSPIISQKKHSRSKSVETKEIETGRVEKGSSSDQLFKGDYSKFESSYSWISEWKILPESRKEITIDDLVEYCVICGRKKKANKNEIYCPKCGNKF